MKIFILSLVLYSTVTAKLNAQTNSPGIRIYSESKQIFEEDEMLKKVVDDVYFEKIDQLKSKIIERIKTDIKSLTNQTSRAEKITLSIQTNMSVYEKDGKPYLSYTIPGNKIDFSVTTPDHPLIPGLGMSRSLDPEISLTFDVSAQLPLIQNGTVESLKFTNPVWNITFTHWKGERLNPISITKSDIEYWVKGLLETSFFPIYVSLNDASRRLTDYISSAVINNGNLAKELALDETRQLQAKADQVSQKIIFIHNYSKEGMVKRVSTNKAGTAGNESKINSGIKPVYTTSATEALKSSKINVGNKKQIKPVH
ncbi:hypothetical protein [Flavisolibacter ginsengisoli]|jgi:hypothetical protein|uniref:Uncharacterized protein n=1 Tax=Flavisolibacter ginsengisoli DSM 18119 TaxID=1121884 RepID=A0A1M4SG15_9BACT|nr:hypothetical protein [Flavisolibacter ginsengisoli]SHE31135.1 hypothetical protein SAMN02745131_00104 [Flavisolibacter ginsengisoli DSM 18119]